MNLQKLRSLLGPYYVVLQELTIILWPHIKTFLIYLRDSEARKAAIALNNAKTVEEKHDAAKKIAERLYNRSIGK